VFGDLPCRTVSPAAASDEKQTASTSGVSLGGGLCLTATQVDHSPGRLRHTERSLDVAIQGDGYFQINDGDRKVYTRRGSFGLSAGGEMVLISRDRSRPIEPVIKVPADTAKIVISPSGSVSVLEAGKAQPAAIGQFQLCRFANPEALAPCGEGLFASAEACGNPTVASPGQSGIGELRQGALEESNVVAADELSELRRVREHLKTLQELRTELGASKAAP
jgi:flagellar basal-body rod protein FlgG